MMLRFEISHQHIFRTDKDYIVADSRNYLKASFAFIEDWGADEKWAIFSNGSVSKVVLIENGECLVPWEVLYKAKEITVSVYGGDLITTNKERVLVHESGYGEGDEPLEPTPDQLAQLMEYINNKIADLEGKISSSADGGSFSDWEGGN